MLVEDHAAGRLDRPHAGSAIRYSRGRIAVLDREGLESTACECYALIRREYDRMME